MSILVLTVPGSRQLTVTPLGFMISAKSKVNIMLASLDNE